ncbi:hypothetical protein GCM10023332_24340 [Luteimonas vadosa]|uniref:DUF4064 domain-containing protein n=1 Tax=Luteimonas vadosa TaxID=1165507 RepID=A0ABP9E8W8_9GAMM
MKQYWTQAIRAIAALALALALSTLFGAFSGYWQDPDLAHRIEREMPAYAKRNPAASPEDMAAFYQTLDPAPRPEPPPALVAIVKSNLHLVLLCTFGALVLLRPRLAPAVLVGIAAACLVAVFFGLQALLLFVAAHVLYGLTLMLFPRLQRRAA